MNDPNWTHVTLWGSNSLEETDEFDVRELRASFRTIPADAGLDDTQTIVRDLESRLDP